VFDFRGLLHDLGRRIGLKGGEAPDGMVDLLVVGAGPSGLAASV